MLSLLINVHPYELKISTTGKFTHLHANYIISPYTLLDYTWLPKTSRHYKGVFNPVRWMLSKNSDREGLKCRIFIKKYKQYKVKARIKSRTKQELEKWGMMNTLGYRQLLLNWETSEFQFSEFKLRAQGSCNSMGLMGNEDQGGHIMAEMW